MTFAVVPAAGLSTRMGQPKLGLPLGDSTVLERVIAALRDGGVEVVLVVIGPHMPALIALAESAGATVLCLSGPDCGHAGNGSSRACGGWTNGTTRGTKTSGCCRPAIFPRSTATTVRRLLDIATGDLHCPILVPTIGGRRGHPTAFSWRHVPDILRVTAGGGN